MRHLGVSADTIDIQPLALLTFREIGHAPFGIDCGELDVESFQAALAQVPREARSDLTFENVQARLRTFLLMSRGFVVGTGDLSELALGWWTYNADHMSMYNPNCSIPKTLVKFLVPLRGPARVPRGPGAGDAAVDRGHDDLSRAAAGICRGRDRAIDRGDARPLRAARLHSLSRHPLRLLAREDPLPERLRHVHPALFARG